MWLPPPFLPILSDVTYGLPLIDFLKTFFKSKKDFTIMQTYPNILQVVSSFRIMCHHTTVKATTVTVNGQTLKGSVRFSD